jgi:RNA polymerase sigma factor (sigma-70 family)
MAPVALCLRPAPRSVPAVTGELTSTLVRRAGEGDDEAWREMVRRFGGLVFSIARGFRLSNADAADVSQTVWLRFAEHLDRLTDPERAPAWLATTTRRECLRVVRTSSRMMPTEDVGDRVSPVASSADDDLIRAERQAAVAAAFVRIPEHCQRLLTLLAADDRLPYEAIAKELAMPIGSIGPTRGRCLEHLRRELAAVLGGDLEEL